MGDYDDSDADAGAQIGAFRNILKGNNRPTQPLNGHGVADERW